MIEGSTKILVISFGGNAIHPAGESGTYEEQSRHIQEACRYIARLPDQGWKVVIVHGNGPQIGRLLNQQSVSEDSPAMPLYLLGAQTQGSLGFMFLHELTKELSEGTTEKPKIAALLTRVEVLQEDEAFQDPLKPIGPFMDESEALQLKFETGWAVKEDSGRGFRRVVASPRPVRIADFEAIQTLLDKDFIVIAGGGGGVPIVQTCGIWKGAEAVIDKDWTALLIAEQIKADLLLLVTAVPNVKIHFNTDHEESLYELPVKKAREWLAQGEFASGSMAPKIEAASAFVEMTGNLAIITDIAHINEAIRLEAGTRII